MSSRMDEQASTSATGDIQISVVIGLIAGGSDVMTTCLRPLLRGAQGIVAEFIVPYDDRLDHVDELVREFPTVTFIDARSRVNAAHFGEHSREHHDILRAIGLARARGTIVAMLEDHGIPCPDWCHKVLKAHESRAAAIGGAVENGVDRLLNRAVFYCDFGRYQNPVPSGPAEFLSDSNVAYKRSALSPVQHLWTHAFHETAVNWELRRRGEDLLLDPTMIVFQTRTRLRLVPALRERFVWGRSFAGTRAQELPTTRRLLLAGLAWILPIILTWRIAKHRLSTRRFLGSLFSALPLILLLQTIWALGEFVGYITGHTGGPRIQDGSVKPCAASPS